MKQSNKSKPKAKPKKINILEEARSNTNKSFKDFSNTIEGGRKINSLLLRKSILMAEISMRQNEIFSIDKKINETLKKNPLNDFLSKITTQLEKFEPKEISKLIDAIKPIGDLLDLSKLLANQKTRDFSKTIKTNLQGKKK